MMTSEFVCIPKKMIREGLIFNLEDLQKGMTGFYMVLGALAHEDTRIVRTTYKELGKLTGFSKATITKMICLCVKLKIAKKVSRQGSPFTILELA